MMTYRCFGRQKKKKKSTKNTPKKQQHNKKQKQQKFFPFRVEPFSEGRHNNFDGVAPPSVCVSFPFRNTRRVYHVTSLCNLNTTFPYNNGGRVEHTLIGGFSRVFCFKYSFVYIYHPFALLVSIITNLSAFQ